MNFIVDANLPPALAGWLRALGHDASLARDLAPADRLDAAIWARAGANTAIVWTKDKDFLDLALAAPSAGRVVWVRCGNLSLPRFRTWFEAQWPAIESALIAGEQIIEVR